MVSLVFGTAWQVAVVLYPQSVLQVSDIPDVQIFHLGIKGITADLFILFLRVLFCKSRSCITRLSAY